jgi:VWFA-related protein
MPKFWIPKHWMPKFSCFSSRSLSVLALIIVLAAQLVPAQLAAAQPAADQQGNSAPPAQNQQPASGQQAGSSSQTPDGQSTSGQSPANQSQEPAETIKANVNVVQLFFNVKDKHGTLVPNLTKDEFEVAEDGKPQTIKYFAAESNLPLTLGVLIDTSYSQRNVLDMEKEVGGLFLKQILTDKDEAYVINFDINVELLQDFTRDVHRLQNALNKAKINADFMSGGVPGIGGGPIPQHNATGTALYDAVYLSSHDMLSKEVGRKAMILLTDGEDVGSKVKIKEAIEAAQKADAMVYVLLCADRGSYFNSGISYNGEGEMRKLTEQVGGRVINVGNKFDKLREAFDQIATELRSQYNIGYTPTNTKLDGSYRKLEIKSKQNYKIQARAGYYAGGSED